MRPTVIHRFDEIVTKSKAIAQSHWNSHTMLKQAPRKSTINHRQAPRIVIASPLVPTPLPVGSLELTFDEDASSSDRESYFDKEANNDWVDVGTLYHGDIPITELGWTV